MTQTTLLTAEQHKKVMLNPLVNLLWKNIGGKFVGPFAYPLDVEKFL